MLVCGVLGKVCARGVDAVGAICRTCQTCFQASYPLDEGLKTRDYAVCGAEWGRVRYFNQCAMLPSLPHLRCLGMF